MKAAPIQMNQLSFRRVSVELDVKRFEEGGYEKAIGSFDFENVVIATHVGFAPMEEGATPQRSFLLTLQVVINNQEDESGETTRFSPYLVDIEAGAVIRVAAGAEALGHIEDLAIVNGTSLLWSAIREQVCSLTARMPAGLATLPTVNFHDLRKDRQPKADDPAPKPRKRSVPKKAASGESGT